MAEQKKDEKAANPSAAPVASSSNGHQAQKDVPNLGALDEDDEFEDFDAQGEFFILPRTAYTSILTHRQSLADWEDKETILAHLSTDGGATGLSISGERNGADDHLWEDNWDDDDIEDDFGKVLR